MVYNGYKLNKVRSTEGKALKKLIKVLILTALCVICAKGVMAEVYTSEEYGFSVDIPKDYIVFSGDMEENNPFLAVMGMTKEDMEKLLKENGQYLCAFRLRDRSQINISCEKIAREDKTPISKTQIEYMQSYLEGEYKKNGKNIIKSELYTHPKVRLVMVEFSDSDGKNHEIKYHAIYNDVLFAISVKGAENISKEHEKTIKRVVDGMDFPYLQELSESYEKTDAFSYTDGAGMGFTVPENWKVTGEKSEEYSKSISFTSNRDSGVSMAYVSTDTWDGLPFYVKLVSIGNQDGEKQLDSIEVAELLGVDAEIIEDIEYNGVSYKKAVYTETSKNMGMEIPMPITVLLRVEKGVIHTFQFLGSQSNEHYSEFEEMIKSVYYPESIELLPERAFYMEMSKVIPVSVAVLFAAVIVIAIILMKKSK